MTNRATISNAKGNGTITDNDTAPCLAIDDVTVYETGSVTMYVTPANATAFPILVNDTTANDTAVSTAAATLGTPDFTARATR